MKQTKGYFIIDENEKYVVGYIKEENGFHYVSYDKTERCAIRLFKTENDARGYIEKLNRIAVSIGECHTFSIQVIL